MPDETTQTEEARQPPAAPPEHTLTGEFRTHEAFHSRFLEHDHTIIVSLPPGYGSTPDRRYPVLYLHDGQNVFDRATSVGEEWRVDETAHELVAKGEVSPLIVVGIWNTGVHRIDEYAPTADPEKGGGGKADDYGRMLVQDLKPFIDREYRTLPGAVSTGLGGSSLGGLLTMHLGIRYPTVFSRLAVMSPSVWWDDRMILGEVAALPGKTGQRIWLDSGTKEGEETITNSRALRDALVSRGWVEGQDLAYHEAEGGEHNERSWSERVPMMLKFLFPPA